jgi:hypothetical protein
VTGWTSADTVCAALCAAGLSPVVIAIALLAAGWLQ